MPNKTQGIRDDRAEKHKKDMNWFNKVKGSKRLNRFFQYDPDFPGNPKSPDNRTKLKDRNIKSKSVLKRRKKRKSAHETRRRNRHA